MNEDFRTKSQIYADRLEREHTDPEPGFAVDFCRHCDEETEPVSTREVLTKSHGREATKAILDAGLNMGFDFMCSDCSRPYGMEDHALLDFQQERIELLAGVLPSLTASVELARGTLRRDAEILRLLIENLGSTPVDPSK